MSYPDWRAIVFLNTVTTPDPFKSPIHAVLSLCPRVPSMVSRNCVLTQVHICDEPSAVKASREIEGASWNFELDQDALVVQAKVSEGLLVCLTPTQHSRLRH